LLFISIKLILPLVIILINKGNKKMGNYNLDRRNDNRSGGGRGRFDNNKELFNAVCDKCGKDCKVPFKPSQGKPVYCSSCFEQESGISTREKKFGRSREVYSDRRSSPSPDFDKLMKKMDFIENKVDRTIEMLEELSNAKTYRMEKESTDEGLDII